MICICCGLSQHIRRTATHLFQIDRAEAQQGVFIQIPWGSVCILRHIDMCARAAKRCQMPALYLAVCIMSHLSPQSLWVLTSGLFLHENAQVGGRIPSAESEMPLQLYTVRGGHAENTEEMESHHLSSSQTNCCNTWCWRLPGTSPRG